MYYPVSVRIVPTTTILRERILPQRGEVLVERGAVVLATDVVARCQVPGEVKAVDVSRELRIDRARAAGRIRVAAGDTVQAGEVVAAARGLAGRFRNCRAPADGRVLEVRNGLIFIEAAPVNLELEAGMKGQIASVMPGRGVVISATGALVQGIWGNGGAAEGVLKIMVDSPEKPLRARAIDVSCQGTLIVGGRITGEEVLEQATEAKVRGIIVGSARADLRPALEVLPIPVMLTEGFGTLPLSQPAYSLLQSSMGREAGLDAETRTRWDVKRPEMIVPWQPTASDASPQPEAIPLEEGVMVRIARGPHMGATGTVTHIPARPQVVESGARLPVAEVEVDGDPVAVPLANLELIH